MTVDAGGDPDMIGQAMRPGQLEKPELELTSTIAGTYESGRIWFEIRQNSSTSSLKDCVKGV
jgi:hypothetical protein